MIAVYNLRVLTPFGHWGIFELRSIDVFWDQTLEEKNEWIIFRLNRIQINKSRSNRAWLLN